MEESRPPLSNRLAYLWTALLIAVPAIIFSTITEQTTPANVILLLVISLGVVVIMLFVSLLMFKRLDGGSKSQYLVAVNVAIVIYHITAILAIFSEHFLDMREEIFTFVQPLLIFASTWITLKYHKLNLDLSLKLVQVRRLFAAVFIGISFGLVFWVVREPAVQLFSNALPLFVIFSLAVGISEELLFRFVIFRIAEKAFAYRTALWLQAIVFAAIHLIPFTAVISYYESTPTVLAETAIVSVIIYFAALVAFGYVCGKLMGIRKTETEWENGNLMYAVLAHWTTNFVMLLATRFV